MLRNRKEPRFDRTGRELIDISDGRVVRIIATRCEGRLHTGHNALQVYGGLLVRGKPSHSSVFTLYW
jgi:hypothetical protein